MQKRYQKAVCFLQKAGNGLRDFVNRISIGQMAVGAVVFFVLSVIPLLLLGKYNVMCIDDYDYGRQVHDTWMATGSFAASIETALKQTAEFFVGWQGTYVSCFLMAVCPMNFFYDIAYVVPILMIGMFAAGTFFFGRQILVRWIGSDKKSAVLVMALLLFLFYQVIEAPFEGIYWYNGSTHYVLMQSLLFIMMTLVSGSIWNEKKKNAMLFCIIASVLGVIVGGGNLVSGLQAEILLVFLIVYTFFTKRERGAYVLFPFLFFTAGFLCNILAPGNWQRSASDTDIGYGAVMAIGLSFYYAVVFAIRWTSLMVVLVWLTLLPILWQIGKKSQKKFAHPVWVTIGAVCILAAMFTPTLFAVGMVGLSRVDNIIQMVYYLSLFFVTTYWFGWCAHQNQQAAIGTFLEKTKNLMTMGCLCLVVIVWLFTADKNTYTSISAVRSLVNGEAQTYYEEAMERHELYVDETVKNVVVEPFSKKPALFAFEDLTTDSGNWLNLAVARYYHKESVVRTEGEEGQ